MLFNALQNLIARIGYSTTDVFSAVFNGLVTPDRYGMQMRMQCTRVWGTEADIYKPSLLRRKGEKGEKVMPEHQNLLFYTALKSSRQPFL